MINSDYQIKKFNVVNKTFTSTPNQEQTVEIKEQKTNTTTKAVVGVAAALCIAASVIGVIRYQKGKNIAKEIEKLTFSCKPNGYSGCILERNYNSTEQIAKRFEEISKLSPKKRLEALREFETDISNLNLMVYWRRDAKVMDQVPENIKDALAQNDLLKAAELYRQQGINLPTARVLPTTGATVEESILNILGKDSKIKPHTYDKTKENDVITVYRSCGGYKDGFVNSKNEVNLLIPGVKIKDGDVILKSVSHMDTVKYVGGNKEFDIYSGVVHGTNRRQVTLKINTERDSGNVPYSISIISPDSNFTPAQLDLLEIAKNPKNFDKNVFDEIVKVPWNVTREELLGPNYINTYGFLNYDVILSAIQSMAK